MEYWADPWLSHHHWYPTRRDLAWSPRPREIGSDFHFLIIAPTVVNFSPGCLLFSCSPSQPCASLQFCPWYPYTAPLSCPWWKCWNVIDCVDRCLLYSYITMSRVDTGLLGNELRLGGLLNGKQTGLWEPELLVGRGSNTYFMQKYDNKCIKCIWCCYSGFFCDILSLSVTMHLWLKLYTVPLFVSGQTYKISKGSNNYCSHCMLQSSPLISAVPGP